MIRKLSLILLLVLLAPSAPAAPEGLRISAMRLDVSFEPAEHRVEGEAILSLAGEGDTLEFHLHTGLELAEVDTDEPVVVSEVFESEPQGFLREIRLTFRAKEPVTKVRLRYRGTLSDAVKRDEKLDFVIGDGCRGHVGVEGIFLVASSGWYPVTGDVTVFEEIRVDVPEAFRVVTQGGLAERAVADGREQTVWTSDVPVDGLALQAGAFQVASRQVGETVISTYLSPANAGHAEFILDEIEEYLSFYEPLLGPYPWPKFDVVENFFTTGYGMPSYTLLGGNVVEVMVRMAPRYGGHIPPGFVDHELVHCWWGNYVYPDYMAGNWCEGLTTYCSNYLMKEERDPAAAMEHRKKICTNFAIRVDAENDYPVRAFKGKTEDFDNDIGYGKSAMIFHMLRRKIGDRAFFAGLPAMVSEFGGKKTSWLDFQHVFEKTSGQDLKAYFDQWLDRTGAPDLQVRAKGLGREEGGKFAFQGEILQTGEPWELDVPVRVDHFGGAVTLTVPVAGERTPFTVMLPRPPLSISLDPEFELFRRVPLDEIQPCLNLTLETKQKSYVVPAASSAYAGLAGMAKARKGGEILTAAEELPSGNLVLFGRPDENPAVATVLEAAGVTVEGNAVTVKGQKHEGEDLWLLLSTRHPEDEGKFVTVFFGMTEKALGRARVIFHFGWDGFLVYRGRPLDRGEFTEIQPRTTRSLVPEIEPVEIEEVVDALIDPVLEGRRAGTEGDAATRKLLVERLETAGVEDVREVPFSFGVREYEEPVWMVMLEDLGEDEWKLEYPGAVFPAVFSAETPDEGLIVDRIVTGAAAGNGGAEHTTLHILDTEARDPAGLLEAIRLSAEAGNAAVAIPLSWLTENRALMSWGAYPSQVEKNVPDPWRVAAGLQARAPDFAPGIPVLFVDDRLIPPGEAEEADASLLIHVRFTEREVKSANLVGVIPDREGNRENPTVAIGAHFDGLGIGNEGADDNATGVAAVLTAANRLASHTDLLGSPVRVFLFGAEEWGLYGSRAAAKDMAGGLRAFVNLDTIGAKDVPEVFLVGRTHHPELATALASALEAAGLPVGKDIDRYAFAHGSDHYTFHQAGVPSIDIFSGAYRRMNSTADVRGLVDPAKVAKIAGAVAVTILDQAPRPPRFGTLADGESKHLANLRMLTNGGENAEAYFPPEEDRLCFQSTRDGLSADQIFVMDLDGGNARMVSNGKGATTCSYLFPGSKRILYATTSFNGDEPPEGFDRRKGYVWRLNPEYELVVHDLDGSNQVRLTEEWGYDAEGTLSRDGEWVVFTSTRDGGDPEIYKMRVDGTELTRLTNAPGYDGGPFFSFDGTQICWRANRPDPESESDTAGYEEMRKTGLVRRMNLEIWVMNADGSNQRQITDNGAANFAPFFHPDGKRVIFCSNLATLGQRRMPNFDLWIVNTDGTGTERVTTFADFDGFPMFTSDGKKLVFCSNRDNGGTRETNVFLADWKD